MPSGTSSAGAIPNDCSDKSTPVLEDEFVVITPLIFGRCPCCVARKESGSWRVNSQQVPELDEDSNPVFWNEHGRLQEISGKALGDGEQSWTRTLLGFTCFIKELDAALVVLDISDPSLLIGLETMFQCEHHRRGIAAVIHLSPKPVIQSQAYASWTENSHSFHVLANSGSPKFGFKASLKTIAKLNLIDEKFFPLPRYNECPGVSSEAGFLSRVVLEKRGSGVLVRMDHSGCSSSVNVEEFQNNLLDRKPGIRDWILSQKQMPEQRWSSNQLAAAALRQNLLLGREKRASLPELVNEFELLFLGTGSAEPSKYRGSSGILLRIGDSSMLLDAGEGVLGQVSRRYGEKTSHLVQSLECLWLSHKHADHVLGAPGVICARMRETKPLIIIGSTAVGNFLREVAAAQALSGNPMPEFEMIHFQGVGTSESFRGALEKMKLRSMIQVQVFHCFEAYGLVLVGEAGWRIVYSGDTRPSERLIQAGAGCTLLIHEATFEDCLGDHAQRKRHSTITEALEVGNRMQAQQVILTHFSQRYPKAVTLDTERFPEACMAFDGMAVNSLSLKRLRGLLPVIEEILADDQAEEWFQVNEIKQAPVSTHIKWSDIDIELAKPKHTRWSYSDDEE